VRLRVLTAFFLVITTSLHVNAGVSPVPPGKYIGFNTAEGAYGETQFDIPANGMATVTGADGDSIVINNFDFGNLVHAGPIQVADAATQVHMNKTYTAFHPISSRVPLILIKNYLIVNASFEDTEYALRYINTPSIFIYPHGIFDENAQSVALFSPKQVADGLFEKAVATFEARRGISGSVPRLKTGGKNFRKCLEDLKNPSKPN
jgi:hypothetical protein